MIEQQELTLSLEQTIQRFDLKIKKTTLAQNLSRGKKNGIGVPLTLGFHYTKNFGEPRILAHNFDRWMADDVTQFRDIASRQKELRKIA